MIEVEAELERGDFRAAIAISSRNRRAAIFGRSGAGKTTILDAIAGLRTPRAGRIRVGDHVLFDSREGIDRPPRQRRIGYVRQAADLFPRRDVAEQLAFARGSRGISSSSGDAALLDAFGLMALSKRLPDELSGGQIRRVQIARSLASRPELLLLDEPLANLDAGSRAEVLAALARLREDFDLATILVSHQPEEILAFAEEVFVLEDGRVVDAGDPDEVLSRRGGTRTYLRVAVESVDSSEGTVLVRWGPLALRLPLPAARPGTVLHLALEAADVLLAAEFSGRISARNAFAVRVHSIEERAGERLVQLDAEGGRLVASVTPGAAHELEIAPGVRLTAIVKAAALRPAGGLE